MDKILKKTILAISLFLILIDLMANTQIVSPDKKISVSIKVVNNSCFYNISYMGEEILRLSRLGITMQNEDFYNDLKLISSSSVSQINDNYTLICDKRSTCTYKGNEKTLYLKNKNGHRMNIIFRVSNDGVAFSYQFPEKSEGKKVISEEKTSFKFPSDATAWLHPHRNSQTGWSNSQPSYEENYRMNIPVGTPAEEEAGWSFPALFRSKGKWILITESGLGPNYCGSRLSQISPDGEYSITFAQKGERVSDSAAYLPQSELPWQTPWRLLIIGELKDIVESTLVTDFAFPQTVESTFVKPGKSSWSWAMLKDDYTVYDVQKLFIDYASRMNWAYCLIDADWHKKIGYEKIAELVDYAAKQNVSIIIWYNSAGSWNTTPYGPRDMMLDPVIRKAEFEKISKMGVKGVKVDFWGGDGQSMIKYYYDLFEDAAKYGLLVNCHGTTIPRGWSRTFPNLVTMEAVKGFEFVTFEQANADVAPKHCAILPFTRNVIGPMDFTPVCLTDVPNIKRKTNNGFELALAVLFQSGIQHYVETPVGMAAQPDFVKDFLRKLPAKWDDIRFIDGFPGEYVIIARKAENKWYVAGINSTDEHKKIEIDLSFIEKPEEAVIITDGETQKEVITKKININNGKALIEMKTNGGFIIHFE